MSNKDKMNENELKEISGGNCAPVVIDGTITKNGKTIFSNEDDKYNNDFKDSVMGSGHNSAENDKDTPSLPFQMPMPD